MPNRTRAEIEDDLADANALVRRLKAEWSAVQPETLVIENSIKTGNMTFRASGYSLEVEVTQNEKSAWANCFLENAADIAAWFAYHFPVTTTEETS